MSIVRALEIALFVGFGLALNAGAAYAAFRNRSVSGSGAIAGAVVGAAIYLGGGFSYWLMLMLFFVSSSAAGRIGRRRRPSLEQIHERGNRRDAVQVVANGGVPAIAAVLLGVTGHAVFALAAAGALAAATADTWASELGVLSRRRPRSIVTLRALEPGTSGGVSLLGTGAAAAGSLLIATCFALIEPRIATIPAIAAVWAAGLAGMTLDSVLGATVQAQYRDGRGTLTERRTGDDGPNELVRGSALITNDVVNCLSVLCAAVIAALAGAAWAVSGL